MTSQPEQPNLPAVDPSVQVWATQTPAAPGKDDLAHEITVVPVSTTLDLAYWLEIERQRQEHERELERQRQEHEREIERQRQEHEREMRRLRNDFIIKLILTITGCVLALAGLGLVAAGLVTADDVKTIVGAVLTVGGGGAGARAGKALSRANSRRRIASQEGPAQTQR